MTRALPWTVSDARFLISTALTALSLSISTTVSSAAPDVVNTHFRVDQFGYPTTAEKVAVVGDPVVGFDSGNSFTPSGTLEVRRGFDDMVVFTGPTIPWSGGAVHTQSGDRAYSFDFSALTTPGDYYIFDPVNGVGSFTFEVRDDVYALVLREAVRTYYYQRCGVSKTLPFAEPNWTDAVPCHLATEQDLDCRFVLDPSPSTSRDLSGGWHDAGDYNKYINFADGPVHALLSAFEATPFAFTDCYGLPESANGIPDLLDEVRFELDWFLKMQIEDGSLLHKVSVTTFDTASPPSQDSAVRRYAPATASATISGCAVFAHAALVFASLGDPNSLAFATVLEDAALDAWSWLAANPGSIPSFYDNAGFVNAPAEDGAYEQAANQVCAAIYLFALTGNPTYRTFVDANYASVHLLQWQYAYEFESLFQDALLYHTATPGATVATVSAILDAYRNGTGAYLAEWSDGIDPYRAPIDDNHYVWGSNRVKAEKGLLYANRLVYGIEPANEALYRDALAGFVHYLHGVNPLALVYLTNMNGHGAEQSVDEFYHGWFGDGTEWDSAQTSPFGPAPGFVPGGPNPFFAPDPSYSGPPIEPPQNQPAQKSFLDWNTSWPENSWEVTENSITYQAAYVKLLAKLVPSGPVSGVSTPLDEPQVPGNPSSEHGRLEILPNPAGAQATLRFHAETTAPFTLTVVDARGRSVFRQVIQSAQAERGIHLDLESWVSGVYFVKVTGQADWPVRASTLTVLR